MPTHDDATWYGFALPQQWPTNQPLDRMAREDAVAIWTWLWIRQVHHPQLITIQPSWDAAVRYAQQYAMTLTRQDHPALIDQAWRTAHPPGAPQATADAQTAQATPPAAPTTLSEAEGEAETPITVDAATALSAPDAAMRTPPDPADPVQAAWIIPLSTAHVSAWTNPQWITDQGRVVTWRHWRDAWAWLHQHAYQPQLWTPRTIMTAAQTPQSVLAAPWYLGQVGRQRWIVWQGSSHYPRLGRRDAQHIWLATTLDQAVRLQSRYHAHLYAPSVLRLDYARSLAQSAAMALQDTPQAHQGLTLHY